MLKVLLKQISSFYFILIHFGIQKLSFNKTNELSLEKLEKLDGREENSDTDKLDYLPPFKLP